MITLTVNYNGALAVSGGLQATTTMITAGLFVSKPPSTFGSISVTLPALSAHPMAACRCYYSIVQLEPSRALAYIEANTSKEIIYENFLYNAYNNIPSGGTFSQLIQSGIKNPIGIIIVPLISTIASPILGNAGFGFSQYASPYDT